MDRRWAILGVLFLARTAMGFQFQSIASTGPFLVDSLRINYTELGTLIGLYFLPGVLISLPGGVVMQRFGDKAICAAGLALMIVGGLLVGKSHGFGLAFVGRLVSGTGAILFNLVLTKMATDWFAGREIVFAMGVVLASWPFGIAAGLLVQPAMAAAFGWPLVMDAGAALCALALILVALAYYSPARDAAAASAAGNPLALPPPEEIAPVSVASVIWANANVGLVLFFSFVPPLLRELGFAPETAAALPSYALWIVMLSVPLGGYLVERSGRPDASIVLFCGLAGISLALFATSAPPALLCIAFGLTMGPPAGAVMALPARVLSPRNRAAGLGIFFTIYYTLMAAGPAFAGWLRDRFGTAEAAVLFAAVLFLAILPLLWLFRRLVGDRAPA